ncbi:MAG: hypothetical protein ACI35S_00515 [Anaeroplasma sp.]
MNKKLLAFGATTFLGGAIVGAIVEHVAYIKRNTFGKLKVNTSDPDKDQYCIELNDLDGVEHKKRVILQIEQID